MPRRSSIVSMFVCAPLLVAAGCSSGSPTGSEVVASSTPTNGGLNGVTRHWYKEVCPMTARPGVAKCMSHVVTDQNGKILAATTPQGYGPSDLQSAYGYATTGGSSATIALVDAQDDPNAEADLGTYRAQYGLPACTTANGCFKKVNQNGVQAARYPTADSGWATEISLDLDMVERRLPELQDHPRRDEQRRHVRPRRGRERSGDARRDRHQQQLRRRGGLDDGRRIVRVLQSPRRSHHGERGRRRLRRQLPGDVAVRPRRRRHDAHAVDRLDARLDRDRLVERRQRLQRVHPEALVPDGHGLFVPRGSRRRRERRPEHRRRRVRLVRRNGRLDRRRRDERELTARRVDLRGDRKSAGRDAAVPVLEPVALLRHHERLERLVQPVVPVHRGRRLRRPDRLGIAQRVHLGLVERK